MKTFCQFLNEINLIGLEKFGSAANRSTHKLEKYKKGEDVYYVKFTDPELQSVVEHLAYKIYALFGIKTANSHLVVDENKESLGIATKEISGKIAHSHHPLIGHKDINDGYFVDAFLANWDTMGLNFDNIIISDKSAYRIDPGGSLTFRARGGRKNDSFEENPGELDTFKDPTMSMQAGLVFSKMQKNDIIEAANVFKSVSWNQIEQTINFVQREALYKVAELIDEHKKSKLTSEINQDISEITFKLKIRYVKIREKLNEF